jgi:hypothetical protein
VQAVGQQPQRAPDGARVHCQCRRPDQTALYRLEQQHAATSFEQAQAEAVTDLPLRLPISGAGAQRRCCRPLTQDATRSDAFQLALAQLARRTSGCV